MSSLLKYKCMFGKTKMVMGTESQKTFLALPHVNKIDQPSLPHMSKLFSISLVIRKGKSNEPASF
jgi:hypothetical protein